MSDPPPRFPFAKYFGEINVLADLQFAPGDKPYADRAPRNPERKPLLLYLGCNVLRTAHLVKTVIEVLRAMGFDFNAVGGPAYCCGIVHHLNGEPQTAARYVDNSLRHFDAFGLEHVLMWCPSCNEHYDDVVAQRRAIDFPYEHVTAFIARHLDRVRFARRVARRVALHYHTGHPQQDADWANARAVLTAIPGIEYVEVTNPTELGRHCSARYIARAGGRTGWQTHVDAVLRAAADADVDVLATIYHSCQREICGEQARTPFEIVNWISLLGEAMGIQHADVFKRYKLMADPDAAFEEVRADVEAHALDAERVREVLRASFAPACETRPGGPS